MRPAGARGPGPGVRAHDGRGFEHRAREPLCKATCVELFAGTAGIARAFASRGWRVYSYEIDRDVNEDVMSREAGDFFDKLLESCETVFFWAGITCASWSRARRGRPGPGGWPEPLRDDCAHLMGLPNLTQKDCERVRLGNLQAAWLVRLIKKCVRASVPIVVENPASSRLWIYLDKFAPLATANVVFNQCMFGTPYKKPTRLRGWNLQLAELERRCHGKELCERSGSQHVVLSGTDAGASKGFKTAAASPYPLELCQAVVRTVMLQRPKSP